MTDKRMKLERALDFLIDLAALYPPGSKETALLATAQWAVMEALEDDLGDGVATHLANLLYGDAEEVT